MCSKYIQDIKVLGLEKIRKDIAGKRYEFVLRVTWSNNTEATIYRPHSMFFDFQGVLAEMFKNEKIPSAPVVKFHWALLGKLGHEKECKSMEEFCLKIIRLPPVVSSASIVLHFFETWGTDLRTNQKSSELFDPVVGRPSIQSSQERGRTNQVSDEKEDQYQIVADYQATNVGEISLIEGKQVTIIEKNERGWWFIADDTGKQGWAPATYLEPIVTSSDDLGYDWVSVMDVNGKGEQYVAMVSYDAQNNDELSYKAQEQIEVLEKSNYGWWRVRINDKTGITPATNLQRVDDTCIYQSADELKTRAVSISSASGLYAVIRKPPPRRESVRSRSSSGISQLQSPAGSLKNSTNGLTGKKPSRFVYSAASFAGGKFVIGDDEKVNSQEQDSNELPNADESAQNGDMYVNVNSESLKKNNSLTAMKSVRSKSTEDALLSIHLNQFQPNMHPSYANRRFSKPGEGNEVEFYSALLDYVPTGKKKEDIALQKGDIVQLISNDSGWMFVVRVNGEGERKGWVPENYLERRYDIDLEALSSKGSDPRPKPRPRPAPRPKNKLLDLNQPARGPPAPPRRVSLAETMEGRPLPPISHSPDSRSNVAKKMANRPPLPAPLLDDIKHIRKYEEDTQEEDFYDEPETQLRSVYDCEPWYFGTMSRADAERVLGTYGRQLEFLVRDSQRLAGSYALSVKYCYRIRHFPIKLTKDQGYLIGNFTFPNLIDIIAHYQKHAIFFSEHKEPIILGKCFPKENWPTK